MAVEEGVVLGVGVEEIEGLGMFSGRLGFGFRSSASFYVLEEATKYGELEGVEEKGEGGFGRKWMGCGVGVVEPEWSERFCCCVLLPEGDVGGGDAGEVGVQFDAFDAEEGKLRSEEHGTSLACADIEEDGVFDGLRCGALQPDVEKAMKDAGGDAVVGGELFYLGLGASSNDGAGDEAGGIGAMELVKGVDRGLEGRLLAGHLWG